MFGLNDIRERTEYLITLAIESICNNYTNPKFSIPMCIEETINEATKNTTVCLILFEHYKEIMYHYTLFVDDTNINVPVDEISKIIAFIVKVGIYDIITSKIIKRGIEYSSDYDIEFIESIKQ